MASNPNSFTTVNSPESIALVAMILSGACVLYCLVAACRLSSFTCWPDRQSAEFELRAGVTGTWVTAWEEQSGRDRLRPIWLEPRPWRENGEGFGAEVEVNVEPPEAVSAPPATTHPSAWIPVSGVIIDPPRVHRIDYRVLSVDPALAGTRTRVFVPGSPDSEHPEMAPFFAWAAVWIGLLGFFPSYVWFRKARSACRLSSTTT
jgi:hypothetical protein